jgi:hypothetical protein
MLEVPEDEAGRWGFELLMRFRRAFRVISIPFIACARLMAASAWFVGFLLIEPQNHTVAMPAGFLADTVRIPGVDHAVSGWWVDAGNGHARCSLGSRSDRTSKAPEPNC